MLDSLSAAIGVDFSIWTLLLLVLAAFFAGYIDAIAGGGGMIQALALLLGGIPPHATLATNKVVSLTGTLTAVIKYAKGRAIPWKLVGACLIPCLLVSALGSKIVIHIDAKTVTWLLLICIPIALIVALLPRKNSVTNESSNWKKAVLAISPIAFYDGLVGPGTGTYMALMANKALGMRFLRATGFTKPLNLATNVGSAVVFISAGKVLWLLALPMIVANVSGAYFGSHSAIKHGDGFIQKVMLVMLTAMLITNIYQALS